MKKKYCDILKSDDIIYDVVNNTKTDVKDAFKDISDYAISPVIYMYTSWLIHQAEQSGIEKIYFFARDAYLMYQIAQQICENRNNSIHCSYFYCSRYALRMSAYWLKDDCAYDKLFYFAFQMSAKSMLQRADFSESERCAVYNDIGYREDENSTLGRKEFSEFIEKVRISEVFNQILYDKSYSAYKKFCMYVTQEEISKYNKVSIVDLGWNGSMQYTLWKLLATMGMKTELHGFYLGMFSVPPKCVGNHYSFWLFGPSNTFTKSWFSHNLLECVCSAPHGMTIGYDEINGNIRPKLAKNENNSEAIHTIIDSLHRFHSISSTDYKNTYKKISLKLLFHLMVQPDPIETETLNRYYSFCDDVAEQYHRPIAPKANKTELKKEILPFKFFYKNSSDGLYWYYGSVVSSGYKNGFLYKLGYTFTKYAIYFLK